MQVYEIPLSPQPQKFAVALGGVNYRLTVKWSASAMGGWFLDIATPEDVPVISGIPLVTGANLLAQYDYLGFTGGLAVQTDFDVYATPTFDNLGQRSHLFFVTVDG